MTKTKPCWAASDTTKSKYIGILEFQDDKKEWHDFEVLQLGDRLVFGGSCNTCFLESGYILREEMEHIDETLSELLSDLQTYYNDGANYCTRIVCNERM